jgi:hypothetical protein
LLFAIVDMGYLDLISSDWITLGVFEPMSFHGNTNFVVLGIQSYDVGLAWLRFEIG